ncbi:hypothetical protein [Adlercreutzia caecimuris]|uniref:hypothetical protein n=1 Tax=Adlercreutzia caecimuris TaxID=671266 RepID=UPI00258CF238|nr:hypothetical protein [Adlercreutzia caecimuris]
MENRVKIRACFTGCNIKSGKTVIQFELDPEHKGALPQLAIMTGTFTTLEMTSDQLVIPVDASSGEVLDGQDEAFDEEFWVDGEKVAFELPPADFEYEEDEAA